MENADCTICEGCVYKDNHPCPFEKYHKNFAFFCILKNVKETENSCRFFLIYHPSITSATSAKIAV